MLQQTQTSRVEDPWCRFLGRFPTPSECADAPLADVLRLWSGLGYHRRAKNLHEAARVMRDDFDGQVPDEVAKLLALPGVGRYTANAVASFAFGRRVAVVDTNVGRVLARAIANRSLSPREAQACADELLPRRGVADFNQAMIDLGAQFCRATPRCDGCPVGAACRWRRERGVDPAPGSAGVSRPQPAFLGSDRQLRGRLIAELRRAPSTRSQLLRLAGAEPAPRFQSVMAGLVDDGLVHLKRGRYELPAS